MSISETVVTWAEVLFERTMCSAVLLRIGDMGTSWPTPGRAVPAAGAGAGPAGGAAAGLGGGDAGAGGIGADGAGARGGGTTAAGTGAGGGGAAAAGGGG